MFVNTSCDLTQSAVSKSERDGRDWKTHVEPSLQIFKDLEDESLQIFTDRATDS